MANPFPFTSGQVLTAAQMNGIGEWTSYTPVLTASVTNPTLGTGSQQLGSFARIQNLIICRFYIAFGASGTNAGSGSYRVSLPVNANPFGAFFSASSGQTSFFDSSANNIYFANGYIPASTYAAILVQNGFNTFMNDLTNAVPVIPAANDVISGYLIYQAA